MMTPAASAFSVPSESEECSNRLFQRIFLSKKSATFWEYALGELGQRHLKAQAATSGGSQKEKAARVGAAFGKNLAEQVDVVAGAR
ncbi:hypothetical protein, partial [Rhodoblastus sp.]|uniref:hypothetical protein n=1 Tax=Rhodoblastus sp. TaxID=1962975 RepID=UPI003F959D1E